MSDRGPAGPHHDTGDPPTMTPEEKFATEREARHDVVARGRPASPTAVQQYLSRVQAGESSGPRSGSQAPSEEPQGTPRTPGPSGSGSIVVGVDGSPSSERALRWAVDRARQTGQPVDAVIAWDEPVVAGIPVNYGIGQISATDWAGTSREILDETVRATLTGDEATLVRQRVVHGHPAKVLLDAAADADLLVVGCRGHGGFVGMLIGSVSQHLIAHARCPVTVVRETAEPADSTAPRGSEAAEEFAGPPVPP